MNKILSIATLLVLTGLMVSGCVFPGNQPSLIETSWKQVSYGPTDKPISAAPGIETSLYFGRDGRVSGNMGCNSFGGNYHVKNGEIFFSQMVSTMMACQGSQMDQERATLNLMNGAVRFQVDGDMLRLFDASVANAILLSR